MSPVLIVGVWNWGQPGAELLANSAGILVLLAATFVVFRSFREHYLVVWIAGWFSYLVYRLIGSAAEAARGRGALVLYHTAFVLAIAFFSAAVLLYVQQSRRLPALASVAAVALAMGFARVFFLPDSPAVEWMFRASYMLMAIGAAAYLVRFGRGRRHLGPSIMAVALVLLHFDAIRGRPHSLYAADMGIELLLGLSMLAVVFDDSKARIDRLHAVNAITTAIAQAQDQGTMVRTALEELKTLLGACAAWFRVLQGNDLVVTHQIGVSEHFLRQRAVIDAASFPGARIVQATRPIIIGHDAPDPGTLDALREEGFDHLVVIPVLGKSSVIGALCLAQRSDRRYPRDEIEFLSTAAHQIGIAVENLELMQQILRSHREWIRTFDAIEDWILVHNREFRIVRMNRAMLDRLGGDYSAVVLRSCEDVLPRGGGWNGCPYCDGARANFSEGPDPCFGGFSIVTSSTFTDESSQLTGTIHIIRDTTERRAAEEKYRLLFEQAQEGVFVTTPAGEVVDCNDAFVRMLGYESRDEVMNLDVTRDIYADPAMRSHFAGQMAEKSFVRNFEVELRRRDGSTLAALENSFATRDAAGNITRYQGFLLDITEIKRAEDEIRRRNRELHALNAIAVVGAQSFDRVEIVENALRQVVDLFAVDTAGVWLLDDQARGILRRSAWHGHRATTQMEFKLPAEVLRLLRDDHVEVITPETSSVLPEFAREFAAREGLVNYVWVLMWSKDHPIGVLGMGSRVTCEFSATDRSLLVAIGRQIATTLEKVRLYQETRRAYEDLRRTQEQLLQSEKMSAMGQLISGVAHELNNPLTAILGYAELLEGEPLSERARDFTSKLGKQAQRTQRLVQNLLSFSRQRKPEKKLVDVRSVLEDTLDLRDYDLKLNNISVVKEFDKDLPAVLGDRHQIEQVFLNIINNAVDAILEKGRGGKLRVSIRQLDGRICAEFHDSGPGIREPKRVFDPFYTTKGVGKGTGLGLSICYGIVKEHGGEIDARNHSEGGASFRVLFPASSELVAFPPPPPPELIEQPLQGRVLVVDDEDAVREFEREALISAGASVVAASNGEEALAHLECDHFDAVILDTSMPGAWSGIEIYRWITKNHPRRAANIILAVSSISEPEARPLLEAEAVLSLVKPFQIPDLIQVTRRALMRKNSANAP